MNDEHGFVWLTKGEESVCINSHWIAMVVDHHGGSNVILAAIGQKSSDREITFTETPEQVFTKICASRQAPAVA